MINDKFSNPRVIIVQKIYSKYLNKDSEIIFSKHRYKKFIKDVTLGTLERKELIEETIDNYLSNDMNLLRTEKLLIVLLHAAISIIVPTDPIPVTAYVEVTPTVGADPNPTFGA